MRISKHPDIEFVKFCKAKLTKLIIGTAGIGGRKKLLPGGDLVSHGLVRARSQQKP